MVSKPEPGEEDNLETNTVGAMEERVVFDSVTEVNLNFEVLILVLIFSIQFSSRLSIIECTTTISPPNVFKGNKYNCTSLTSSTQI